MVQCQVLTSSRCRHTDTGYFDCTESETPSSPSPPLPSSSSLLHPHPPPVLSHTYSQVIQGDIVCHAFLSVLSHRRLKITHTVNHLRSLEVLWEMLHPIPRGGEEGGGKKGREGGGWREGGGRREREEEGEGGGGGRRRGRMEGGVKSRTSNLQNRFK